MSKPKKQHIVPRVYLEWFTNKKWLVNFFDRNNGKYKEQNPKTVTTITNFYTLKDENWNNDYSIEKFFWAEVESKLPFILWKIDNLELLSFKEKDILATFITFQFLRTEVFKNTVDKSAMYVMEWRHKLICENEDTLDLYIEQYEKDKWEKFPLSKEEYKNIYKNYNISPTNTYFLKMILWLYEDMFPIFRNMDWAFLLTKKDTSFLTSDNPFSKYSDWKENFLSWWLTDPRTIKLFPISKNICMQLLVPNSKSSDNSMFYKEVASKKILGIYNSIIAHNSYKVIIWKDKKLIESIVKKNKLKDKEKYESIMISWPLWIR